LIALLNDPDYRIQAFASEALVDIGDSRAIEPLIGLLKDHKGSLPEKAARFLGGIGDPRAIEPLIAILNNPNHYEDNVRWNKTHKIVPL
jgi:HEAT repeat protein